MIRCDEWERGDSVNSQQVLYVLTVAEQKSISRAAQLLYVTQSSLSQSIKNIEKQLGLTLFDRSISPIALTAAGEIYVAYAQRFQALEDELQNALSDCAALKRGSLKIGASPFRIHCMLADSIAAFRQQYAGIQITLHDEDWLTLQTMLQKGELDLVMGTGDYDAAKIQCEPLAQERIFLGVSPDHPFIKRCHATPLSADDIRQPGWTLLEATPVSWDMLADEPLLIPQDPEFGEPLLHAICGMRKLRRSPMHIHTVDTAFAFVMANMGIALLPDSMIRFGNFKSHPLYFALPESDSVRTIQLYYRMQTYQSQAALAYVQCLHRLIDIGTWCTGHAQP